MDITEKRVDEIAVFALSMREGQRGSLDGFQQVIKERLQKGEAMFVLNLADCRWIDSQGLGELVKSLVAVMRQGGNLKLAAMPQRLQAIFSITNLTQVFEIFETEAAALASFEVRTT
ncbi:MAG: STAS domain-containing protein [Acidobacteriota bacterium]